MATISWTNDKRKVADLKPAEYNPRQATAKDVADLTASLDQFNLADPIIINQDNTVIGGHFRLRLLQERGIAEVDVRVPSRQLNQDEERRLNLRLNKNSGRWNEDLLANFDEDMLKEVGFDASELDAIFQLDQDKKDKADSCPGLTSSTLVKRGDLYQLGSHRLLCGDATSAADMARLLDGHHASMIFTDPPYNVDYHGGASGDWQRPNREGIANDRMTDGAFYDFLLAACTQMLNVCDGAVYICMASKEMDALMQAFEAAGGHWSNTIIWVKNTFTLSRSDYQHQHEPILYGWPKHIKNHYFVAHRDLGNVWEDLERVKTKFDGEYTTIKFHGFEVKVKGKAEGQVSRKKWKTDIWRHDKPSRSEDHPTMKPVALVSEAIFNSSPREGLVLDPFGGSGSTLIACELTNRACATMELDPKYCQVIIDRWEEFTGKKAQKLNEVAV